MIVAWVRSAHEDHERLLGRLVVEWATSHPPFVCSAWLSALYGLFLPRAVAEIVYHDRGFDLYMKYTAPRAGFRDRRYARAGTISPAPTWARALSRTPRGGGTAYFFELTTPLRTCEVDAAEVSMQSRLCGAQQRSVRAGDRRDRGGDSAARRFARDRRAAEEPPSRGGQAARTQRASLRLASRPRQIATK